MTSKSEHVDDIYEFIEHFVCNWHNKPIYSGQYEPGLLTFLDESDLAMLLSEKKTYRKRYSHIDGDYLLDITSSLVCTKNYGGASFYYEYMAELGGEIVEYKALVDLRKYLIDTFEFIYHDSPNVQKKVHRIFPNYGRVPHRMGDKLFHQLIIRTDMLAEKYLKDLTRMYFGEQIAYILATHDIMTGLACPYNDEGESLCSKASCLEKRFHDIEMSECFTNPGEIPCTDCPEERRCLAFHPCTPGLTRYKKALQRKYSWARARLIEPVIF